MLLSLPLKVEYVFLILLGFIKIIVSKEVFIKDNIAKQLIIFRVEDTGIGISLSN
jgi:signal transduction histidine kinase